MILSADAIAGILANGARDEAGRALDKALIALHHSGRADELCALHKVAVEFWKHQPQQAAFHRTHAYVYALEAGRDSDVEALFASLQKDQRI